ncbi:MAG: hypothetical protein GXO43_03855 [Crenarchaeota archaeon]|nr:hypothetical protein [Thermoproteota archaeon]
MVEAFEIKVKNINWNEFIKILELSMIDSSIVEAVVEGNNWIALLTNGKILIIPPSSVDTAINDIKNAIPINVEFEKIGLVDVDIEGLDPMLDYAKVGVIPCTVKISGGAGNSDVDISGGAGNSDVIFK